MKFQIGRMIFTFFGAWIGYFMLAMPVDLWLRLSDFEFPISIVGAVGLIGLILGGVFTWKLLKPKEH